MHECSPQPKAMCGLGWRVDLELLGVGAEDLLVAVGRAVEHHDHVALADALPADLDVGRRCRAPCASPGWSSAASPRPRRVSATGPRRACAHSSGCSMSANVPSAIRFRVVSLPATSNRKAKLSRSSSVSLAPSTSAVLKHRQHVVSRFGAPCGDQLLEVLEQLADGHHRIELDLGIGVAGARVGPPAEPAPSRRAGRRATRRSSGWAGEPRALRRTRWVDPDRTSSRTP